MKKTRIYGLMGKIGLFKMIKIMRFTIFILFLSLSQTFAVNSYSQQAKLSLDMRNARLEDVIDKIEKNSEFFFMYNKRMIDVDRKVDIQVEEKSVNDVLDKIFANTDISYSIKDRQILLIKSSLANTGNESITQQQKSVSGDVTDSSGATLPGVSVVVKGTTIGVITDMDGKYSFSKVPENARFYADLKTISDAGFLAEFIVESYEYVMIIPSTVNLNLNGYNHWKMERQLDVDLLKKRYKINYRALPY